MDTNEPPSPSLLNDNGLAPSAKTFDNNVPGTKTIEPARTRGHSSQRKAPFSARNRLQSSISQRRRSPTLTSTKGAQPRALTSLDPELASQQTKSTAVVSRSELVNRGRADRSVSRQRLTKSLPLQTVMICLNKQPRPQPKLICHRTIWENMRCIICLIALIIYQPSH